MVDCNGGYSDLGVTSDVACLTLRYPALDTAEIRTTSFVLSGNDAAGDRGNAVETMARGLRKIVGRLYAEGRLDGILGLGGSGGSSLITGALRALPVGVPKLMVSTVASGDARPYVGASDVTRMYSVVIGRAAGDECESRCESLSELCPDTVRPAAPTSSVQ